MTETIGREAVREARDRMSQGRHIEATELLCDYTDAHPDNLEGWFLLCHAACVAQRFTVAIPAAQRAAALAPDLPRVRVAVALCLARVHEWRAARAEVERLQLATCTDPAVLKAAVNVYEYLSDWDVRLELLERAVAGLPNDLELREWYAQALERQRGNDLARREAQFVLERDPNRPDLQFMLTRIEHNEGNLEVALERVSTFLESEPPPHLVSCAWLERSRIETRLGLHAESFESARRGNEVLLERWCAVPDNDLEAYPNQLRRTLEVQKGLGPVAPYSCERGAPIFLLGFPRSGTTLMQEVLESHPETFTLEEEPLLEDALAKVFGASDRYPEGLSAVTAEQLTALRTLYFDNLDARWPEARGHAVVDKLPLNLARIDLIHRMFPEARILVMVRDPRDCLLSAYQQDFTSNKAMIQFSDLARSADLYGLVMDIWLHARDHSPGLCYKQLRYDDLINEPEPTLRDLLAFLQLPWHDAVLAHNKGQGKQRALRTPSYSDIGKPLYKRALGRYIPFLSQLRPVLPRLEPYIHEYGFPASPPADGNDDVQPAA